MNGKGADVAQVAEVLIGGRTYQQVMRDLEGKYLAACMEAAGCNRRKAAERAGLAYDTFRRRLSLIGLKTTLVFENES